MMRIALLSQAYPPGNTEGIARQRHVLAQALVDRGHDVWVITLGDTHRIRQERGVTILQTPVSRTSSFSSKYYELNPLLAQSEALYAGLAQAASARPFDMVDVPLWQAQGFVALHRHRGPTVVSLQTTRGKLLDIQGIEPTPLDRAMADLEALCLRKATGWLADSASILQEVEREYRLKPPALARVIHYGLSPLAAPSFVQPSGAATTLLVVGRLEERKGTRLLFRILPALLRELPGVQVRFIGRDNSDQDGWHERHGLSYPEYFRTHHPEWASRVSFEGQVSDEALNNAYQSSDVVLAPSLYESFGLVYLEAMRASKPVIALRAGAAVEIFAREIEDGALLCDPGSEAALGRAIRQLVASQELRVRIGENGRRHQAEAFSASKMVDQTLDLYEACRSSRRTAPDSRPAVYQVMEALDYGDGVSNIARANARLLGKLGFSATILADHAHHSVIQETAPLSAALKHASCSLIFHYWGYNRSTWLVPAVSGPHALYYHNITPPKYFETGSPAHIGTARGYAQIAQIVNQYDFLIGDSHYNLDQLRPHLDAPKPSLCIYPITDVEALRAMPHDAELLEAIRQPGDIHLVFVGRIARNKRQDLLLELVEHYFSTIDRSVHLWLVGSTSGDPAYWRELEAMRAELSARDHVHFTGKVSDAEVQSYLLGASVFVCASEHEGFCIPLAQAMAMGVPVVARAAAAVPETMGNGGFVINAWDTAKVAELINVLVKDKALRATTIERQYQSLSRYSSDEAQTRLAAVLEFLQTGCANSPLIQTLTPVMPEGPDRQGSAPIK